MFEDVGVSFEYVEVVAYAHSQSIAICFIEIPALKFNFISQTEKTDF